MAFWHRDTGEALLPLIRFQGDSRPHIYAVEGDGSGFFARLFSKGVEVFNIAATGTITFSGFPVLARSVNYTTIVQDLFISGTGGVGGITITLTASPQLGEVKWVAKVDSGAGAVTIAPNAGQTIYGSGVSGGNVSLASQGNNAMFIYIGANTWIQR